MVAKCGAAITALSGIGTASARRQHSGSDRGHGTKRDDGEVSAQWATGTSLNIDDYVISPGERTQMHAAWHAATPLFAAKHSVVALVEADDLEDIFVGASDFSDDEVIQNFELVDSSNLPVAWDAYKFKAKKQYLQLPGAAPDLNLDASIEAQRPGEIRIQIGYPNDEEQPLGSGIWSGGRIKIE